MKIIFASKFFYRRGGLEAYLFKAKELLEAHGHEVIPFSTNYYENLGSNYSDYFCSYYNLSKGGFSKRPTIHNIKAAGNMFYNKEAYTKMQNLIRDTNPDLVQGFGVTKHLSYSIFKAAKDLGVPTVMRLSDFALLCPNSTATDSMGNLCQGFECSTLNFSKAMKLKCIHESSIATLIGILEVKYNVLFNTYKDYVDYFIAPSLFLREVFIKRFGISPERIIYLPIFDVLHTPVTGSSDEGYFLFAGRLSEYKGLMTLLKAQRLHNNQKLIIAGTSPEEQIYHNYSKEHHLNVDFTGHINYERLGELIKNCRAVIIPSQCYENSPNIVLEAYSYCKPVIGSRIGGIPELIDENQTGLLFEAGNDEELMKCMRIFHDDRKLAHEMGSRGHELLQLKFTPQRHYEELVKLYNSVVRKKILLVNNFYYNRGGDCTYLFSLKKCLEEKGHRTVIFSMHHPQNFRSRWENYFVNYINYDEEVKRISILSSIKVASRTIFFFKAKRILDKLIKEAKPDIAHLQNIHHHITPSILYTLKKHKVPIVWTLHDYQLICPNISFLAKGKMCERCKNNKYFWPVIVKCKKDSRAASLMASVEIIIHNIIGIDKLVDIYIAPSEFLRKKFIEYGFNEDKIVNINHFTEIRLNDHIEETGEYYLFVGRISEEKGVKTLIDAAVKVNLLKLKIVGSGPLFDEMRNYAEHIDENNIIEFLGHKNREEVFNLMNKCRFMVMPSEWYETSGLVILEAFACGKTVIGSNIGGIPELIKNYETGLTFEMGNVEDLSSRIKYMINNPEAVIRMGKNARNFVECTMNAEIHYKELMEIYEKACSSSAKK